MYSAALCVIYAKATGNGDTRARYPARLAVNQTGNGSRIRVVNTAGADVA